MFYGRQPRLHVLTLPPVKLSNPVDFLKIAIMRKTKIGMRQVASGSLNSLVKKTIPERLCSV